MEHLACRRFVCILDPMTRPARSDDLESRLRLLNSEIAERLVRQTQSVDRIDSKVTVLIGLVLTAIPLVADRDLAKGWAIAALSFAIVAITCGALCLRPRDFVDVPEPRRAVNRYRGAPLPVLLGALVGTRVEAFRKNELARRSKVRWWQLSQLAALVAGVLLMIAALVGGTSSVDQPGPASGPASVSDNP